MGEDYVYVREASFLSANHEVGGSFIGFVGDLPGVSESKTLDFFGLTSEMGRPSQG
jgi:hypothetical protein